MSGEKQFLVTWRIDVWAETPEQAAREALRIQRDAESSATFFDVDEVTPRTRGLLRKSELENFDAEGGTN